MRPFFMPQRFFCAENQSYALARFYNFFHVYADNSCISAQSVRCRTAPMLTISSACALETIERLVKE